MDCSTPGLPVPDHLQNLAQVHIHCISDAIQPSSPLMPSSFCPQSFTASGSFPVSWLFSSGPKYWSFSFSISPPSGYTGLTSFRMDWLDLLAVQRTLRSLLQNRSLKASILWCCASLTVQLSQPYVTRGKTIALTKWTFVSRVMSLLFNTLSRLIMAFLWRKIVF